MSLSQSLQTRLVLLNRQQVKVRRNDRQMGKRPLAARRLDALGRHDGSKWPTADERT